MKTFFFTIPLYHYEVQLIEFDDDDDCTNEFIDEVRKSISHEFEGEPTNDVDKELIERLRRGYRNGGSWIYNHKYRKGTILIYPHDSGEHYLETLGHEIRHATDDILEATNVNDIEAAAMLAGYITMRLIK